jgi:hypothetical protein
VIYYIKFTRGILDRLRTQNDGNKRYQILIKGEIFTHNNRNSWSTIPAAKQALKSALGSSFAEVFYGLNQSRDVYTLLMNTKENRDDISRIIQNIGKDPNLPIEIKQV